MRKISVSGYERVSKRVAKSLFNEGKNIYTVPCKLNPTNKFGGLVVITQADGNFEDLVQMITYDSCNSETGKTLWFYIKE